MGLLDQYSESNLGGLGMSPKADIRHGVIIDNLTSNLKRSIASVYGKKLRVMNEIQIDVKDNNSPVPDVCIYTTDENYDPVKAVYFIEVEYSRRFNKTLKKCKQAMEHYGINECHIYNYQTKTWTRLANTEVLFEKVQSPSFCSTFQIDLDIMLFNPVF